MNSVRLLRATRDWSEDCVRGSLLRGLLICSRPGTRPITTLTNLSMLPTHSSDPQQAIDALYAWQEIKDESISQDYMYSLLFRDRSF